MDIMQNNLFFVAKGVNWSEWDLCVEDFYPRKMLLGCSSWVLGNVAEGGSDPCGAGLERLLESGTEDLKVILEKRD